LTHAVCIDCLQCQSRLTGVYPDWWSSAELEMASAKQRHPLKTNAMRQRHPVGNNVDCAGGMISRSTLSKRIQGQPKHAGQYWISLQMQFPAPNQAPTTLSYFGGCIHFGFCKGRARCSARPREAHDAAILGGQALATQRCWNSRR
jgi:hypothetical protein